MILTHKVIRRGEYTLLLDGKGIGTITISLDDLRRIEDAYNRDAIRGAVVEQQHLSVADDPDQLDIPLTGASEEPQPQGDENVE